MRGKPITKLSDEAYQRIVNGIRAKIAERAANPRSKWCPQVPTEKQKLFLSLNTNREVFYGGAAGGAKSSALLMAALEYVDVKGYAAVLLRRTYADLSKPGALMDRAHQWLRSTAAKWNEQKKQWTFPSGATLTFGYLENENDKYQYQGAEYQFVGFDELTQFTESAYTYLFSRLRRLATSDIPLRMRSASNPGGIGARWVHQRFVPERFTPHDAEGDEVWWKEGVDLEGRPTRRAFIPARLDDNPHLDRQAYAASLNELDPVTREQLLKGDWRITDRGDIYPMWDERQHVISWSEFAITYRMDEPKIPAHWSLGLFMDNGTTEGHPNVTSWFATAPENAPLKGSVFLYRGHCVYDETVRNIAETIKRESKGEMDRIAIWRNGHEGNSERISYNRDFGLPFSSWKADRNRGIAQVRNYLEIQHSKQPHPFNEGVMGRPMLYLIVDDDQLEYPRDDRGLARWREEFPAYHYKQLRSGEIATEVVPHPLFNDAMDTVRAAGAEYFAPVIPLSREERVTRQLEKVFHGRTFNDILDLPPLERDGAIHAYRANQAELMRADKSKVIVSSVTRWRKRKHGTL